MTIKELLIKNGFEENEAKGGECLQKGILLFMYSDEHECWCLRNGFSYTAYNEIDQVRHLLDLVFGVNENPLEL